MPHPLSTLGIIHTLLSLIPVIAGGYALLRAGRIELDNRTGKTYALGLIASALTSFGLSSTGGFNLGHALGIAALLALGFAYLSPKLGWLGKAGEYLRNAALTFSFALLFIPASNEILKRVPFSQPLSSGPESPIAQQFAGGVMLLFVLGAAWQAWKLRQRHKTGG